MVVIGHRFLRRQLYMLIDILYVYIDLTVVIVNTLLSVM